MEISIDLKLMREIVFKDEALMKEMLLEWIADSNSKLEEIGIRLNEANQSSLFNKVHELKTNFSMIHCYSGIHCCEQIIQQIENNTAIKSENMDLLVRVVETVCNQLKQFIS